jgi:hypothetical protein
LTFIAALRIDGLTAPYVIGAMDGVTFMAYVEQVLVPTLAKGDIVFMDNLRTHKIDGWTICGPTKSTGCVKPSPLSAQPGRNCLFELADKTATTITPMDY